MGIKSGNIVEHTVWGIFTKPCIVKKVDAMA